MNKTISHFQIGEQQDQSLLNELKYELMYWLPLNNSKGASLTAISQGIVEH